MRRHPSSASWIAFALGLLGTPTLAAQGAGSASGAAFLLVPVGARATALGQAGIADGGSSEAVFWNPAGLATLTASEFGAQYSHTFASRNTALSAYLLSNRLGTMGVSAYLVDYESQDIQNPGGGLPVGRIDPKNIELLASYATDIGGVVTFGISYKLVQFRQDCQGTCNELADVVGTTHAVDLGAQVALGPGGALRLGAVLRHAGFKLQVQNRDQADALPTELGFGAAYTLPLRTANGQSALVARVLADVLNAWGAATNPDARVGAEIAYNGVVYVRAGYAFLHSDARGPALGVGLRFDHVTVDLTRVLYQTSTFEDPLFLGLRLTL
jgi:hypothetical protein